MVRKVSEPPSRRRNGMQFGSMSILHDSTIGKEGNGPAPLPPTSTPAPSGIPDSSKRPNRRNAEHYLRNPGPLKRTVRGAWLSESSDEVQLQPQPETSKEIMHLVHGYDPCVAIFVRVPAFGKTREVILVDPITVTYDKLKRSLEEVILIDETYGRGGNVHIADRDAVEEIDRMYLRRCAGETSEVIEVHEGNVKAVIKLLGNSTAFGELCVEFAQSIGVNARHAEKAKVTCDGMGTEKERDERTLSQTNKSHQSGARPFPNDSWDN